MTDEIKMAFDYKGKEFKAAISREAIDAGKDTNLDILSEVVSAVLHEICLEETYKEASSLNILTEYDDGFMDASPEEIQKYNDIRQKHVVSFEDVIFTSTGLTTAEIASLN